MVNFIQVSDRSIYSYFHEFLVNLSIFTQGIVHLRQHATIAKSYFWDNHPPVQINP